MLGRAPWLATVPLSSHGRCDRPPGHRSGTRRTQVLRPHPRRTCNARDCGVPKRQSQPMRPDAPIELIPPLRSPAVRQTGEPAFERARRHLPPWPAGCARTLERVAGAGSPGPPLTRVSSPLVGGRSQLGAIEWGVEWKARKYDALSRVVPTVVPLLALLIHARATRGHRACEAAS